MLQRPVKTPSRLPAARDRIGTERMRRFRQSSMNRFSYPASPKRDVRTIAGPASQAPTPMNPRAQNFARESPSIKPISTIPTANQIHRFPDRRDPEVGVLRDFRAMSASPLNPDTTSCHKDGNVRRTPIPRLPTGFAIWNQFIAHFKLVLSVKAC